jgi:hypothetical protein
MGFLFWVDGDLSHFRDIWMDGKTKPLCLQGERQMLRQDMTSKTKEAIPDTWNCLFQFQFDGALMQIPTKKVGMLKTTKELASSYRTR